MGETQWRVDRKIGEGQFSEVYLVEHMQTQEQVRRRRWWAAAAPPPRVLTRLLRPAGSAGAAGMHGGVRRAALPRSMPGEPLPLRRKAAHCAAMCPLARCSARSKSKSGPRCAR